MRIVTATNARENLNRLIDEAGTTHQPIHITGKRAGAVLISEADWESIQETLYLSAMPKVRESIKQGLKTPLTECSKELDW